MPPRPAGGCDFPTDPAQEAPRAPVFWIPKAAPAAVTLLARVDGPGPASHPSGQAVFEMLGVGFGGMHGINRDSMAHEERKQGMTNKVWADHQQIHVRLLPSKG